ncbi:e3 ubiquitin- ligase huwe1 [Fusarium longipes]|uniref:E3 ubiquitin-ligase huwe1 n=1 Tax=Fusarium longipes TaxID=694270 RepID=A0A395S0U9_9HYPO|nr:e3 ubiquitin- ligase huwe1 [Fusarium longipes]
MLRSLQVYEEFVGEVQGIIFRDILQVWDGKIAENVSHQTLTLVVDPLKLMAADDNELCKMFGPNPRFPLIRLPMLEDNLSRIVPGRLQNHLTGRRHAWAAAAGLVLAAATIAAVAFSVVAVAAAVVSAVAVVVSAAGDVGLCRESDIN